MIEAEGVRAYFSHFSPRAILTTLTTSADKFKSHYRLSSLNPLYYLDPRVVRDALNSPEALRNVLRVVVVVVAYLLMRPHLDTLFRRLSGAPERREDALKVRVAAMREEERREGRKGK